MTLAVGKGALTVQRRVGEPARELADTPVFAQPNGTPTHIAGSPTQAGEWQLHNRPSQGPDPNLSNLLGAGESTFLVDFQPSNAFTLPGGIGSTFSVKVTNNAEWPLLLKRWSVFASGGVGQVLFRVHRGDGRFVIGDGWQHLQNFSGTNVPAQLGPGIQLERLADLTFEFHNLAAGANDLIIGFEALEIANPEQLPSGRTLAEQVALLNEQHEKWVRWAGLNPLSRGLGFAMQEFGRFYTFPLTEGVVEDDTNAHFQSVDLSLQPPGTPNRGAFRNETGGVFVWQTINYHSDFGGAPAPFMFEINAGARAWKLTEGFVDSRLYAPAGRNVLDQYTPLWLPRPWVIKDQTTIVVNLSTAPDAPAVPPGVWFEAVGILIGGNVL